MASTGLAGMWSKVVSVFGLAFLIGSGPASAVVITVTTNDDLIAANGGVSLREAITAANTNAVCGDASAGTAGYDCILFSLAPYPAEIMLTAALPTIVEEVEIVGPGMHSLRVNGGSSHRPFQIGGGTSVTLAQITAGGTAANGGAILNLGGAHVSGCYFNMCHAADYGGAISCESGGSLWVDQCVIDTCSATYGGAISGLGATLLDIRSSTLMYNHATDYSGAIDISASTSASVTYCSILDNEAEDYHGGGIWTDSNLFIGNSCLSGNSAALGGGLRSSGSAVVTVRNSTFSENSARYSGGGVSAEGGTVILHHVTITSNTADATNSDSGDAGGLHREGDAMVTIADSIVAGNTDRSGQMPDISSGIVSGGFNLVGNLGQATFPSNRAGDHYGDPLGTTAPNGSVTEYPAAVDPLLGALNMNGGITATHGLLAGSIAVDKANPACTTTVDQRGFPRPVGFAADIGAFESDMVRHYLHETYTYGNFQPPGSSTGYSAFGFDTPGFAWPHYNITAEAYIAQVVTDASRFRVTGVISNYDGWMPYSRLYDSAVARGEFYIYAGAQTNPNDLNQIPNLRVRLMNRFAASSMLEVFHQNPGDPANMALARELRPTTDPVNPSAYRVDYDPVDVPYLSTNADTEGVARAFEGYALSPQENGFLALTESWIGYYPATLVDPGTPAAKTYAVGASDAGDLAVFTAAELALQKLIPGALQGQFSTPDPNPPLPTHSAGASGVTLDTSAVGADRIAVAAREFNPDRNTFNYPARVRVEEGKQYSIRWRLTSTQNVNRQAQVRLRARSAKFAWSQKFELGGAWATDGAKMYPLNANNSIAQQTVPGVGGQNPDKDSSSVNGGWYTLMMHTPLSRSIRADFPPGTVLAARMPNLTSEPGPGVNTASRRDIFLGIDLVDSLSGGLGAPLEQGNVTVDRIEIRAYNLASD